MKQQVVIRGRRYTFRSDEGDVDIVAVARYVDARMAEVGAKPGLDDTTVALLAAMNIASDLARLRRQIDTELGAVDRELAATGFLLETLLGDASGEE